MNFNTSIAPQYKRVSYQEQDNDNIAMDIKVPAAPQLLIGLQKWVDEESHSMTNQDEILLRKVTVAYGIVEIIKSAKLSVYKTTAKELHKACHIDNFGICLAGKYNDMKEDADRILGIEMITPRSYLKMITPFFTRAECYGSSDKLCGEYLTVEVNPPALKSNMKQGDEKDDDETSVDSITTLENAEMDAAKIMMSRFDSNVIQANKGVKDKDKNGDEIMLCHLVGCLLYDILVQGNKTYQKIMNNNSEPPQKKRRGDDSLSNLAAPNLVNERSDFFATYTPLLELGCASSIHLLIDGLIKGKVSLDTASDDLHLLVLDPRTFLFERYNHSEAPSSTDDVETKPSLRIRTSKLYGREEETKFVTDSFCRCSISGHSEALLIGGISGIGKSRLVNTLVPMVKANGGVVVRQKFDVLLSNSSIGYVISAFNDLFVEIKRIATPEEMSKLHTRLMQIGPLVEQLLPNISLLLSSPQSPIPIPSRDCATIKNSSIAYILQQVLKVVSSKEKPVMMFFDDLQWTDKLTCNVIKDILSFNGSSCVLFVGAYRSNEITDNHPLHEMIHKLSHGDGNIKKLHLDGISKKELNMMVSDALCMLPRHCSELSDCLYKKTAGSPLFAIEMLRSLVDQNVLRYCTDRRCWSCDIETISKDQGFSDKILILLSTRLANLPSSLQMCLQVASTFGISISEDVVTCLGETKEYSNMKDNLRKAVASGYMEEYTTGAYKFVHDSVREASYNLIKSEEGDQFHFSIGIELLQVYTNAEGQEKDVNSSMLLPIADQLCHGSNLGSRFDLAEFLTTAAQKAVTMSDFERAQRYLTQARTLIPEDQLWDNKHYDFSIQLYLSLGQAAFGQGHIELAKSSWNQVIEKGKTLESKLDAYYLSHRLFYHMGDTEQAFNGAIQVLSELKETMPTSVVEQQDMIATFNRIEEKMNNNDTLVSMKEVNGQHYYRLQQFLSQAAFLAYYMKNSLLPYLISRLVEISLDHGVTKYSAIGYAYTSFMLSIYKKMRQANRYGKVALDLLARFEDSSQLILVYLSYYGFVGAIFEPIQLAAKRLHTGLGVGQSIGDVTTALLCGLLYIQKSFIAGNNLHCLLADVNSLLKLSEVHKHKRTVAYLSLYHQTISQLINKEFIESELIDEGLNDQSMKLEAYQASVYFHRIVACFLVGHNSRALYFAKKLKADPIAVKQRGKTPPTPKDVLSSFYFGLAAVQKIRKAKDKESKRSTKEVITMLKEMASYSQHNYQNKVHILEAELISSGRKDRKARIEYKAAIEASQKSGFVHEEGLACELAGEHCERFRDSKQALKFYKQAKTCYVKWGSVMKADLMDDHISRLGGSMIMHRNKPLPKMI